MRFFLALAAAAVVCWQTPAQATVRIHVDLSSQSMQVTSAEGSHYDWPVSTGRPGLGTPTGAYRPQRMYVNWRSREYGDAPMPHAIFFSGGYAIHGSYETSRLGQPASHGCVRLAPRDAAILYEMVRREGASILITGTTPGGEAVASARARHRDRRAIAARWRGRQRDGDATYASRISPYEQPLGAWSYYLLDGQ